MPEEINKNTQIKRKDFIYDVFISYRRSDGLYPTYLLFRNLMDNGYLSFFDKLSIQGGMFPPQLTNAIHNSKDFILLVTPDTFSKRIFKKDDWVRQEIETALKTEGLNILVLFLDKVNYPKKLPKEIEAIRDCHSEPIGDVFDVNDYQKRLFNRFLVSRPRPKDCIDYKGRWSIYEFDFTNESERLKSQGSRYDDENQRILDMYLNKNNYTVLDVGCAQGYVTRQAFRKAKYTKVVGIDISESAIEQANKNNKNSKFSFYRLDIESPTFMEEMQGIMKQKGIKGFDVVSCFLVLHHLTNPEKALENLKSLMNKGGMIIVRGSDDGSKISYGDDELIEKVLKKSYSLEGMSDRNNGRKLYSWLVHEGFSKVKMHCTVTETSHMSYEEKLGLYKVSFAYRLNYFKAQLIANENEQTKAEFDEMEDLLTQLQYRFSRNDFWYAVNRFVCVGFKK